MRGVTLFVAGIVVGLTMPAVVAQNQNQGIVGLNHVAISVPNLEESVAYYTKVLGFPEAFRNLDDQGRPTLVYVQISRDTFVELQPASAERQPGINHFGLHVQNAGAAVAMFRERRANVTDTRVSGTGAVLSNVTDPNGVRIELAELPPQSLHRRAMERWK